MSTSSRGPLYKKAAALAEEARQQKRAEQDARRPGKGIYCVVWVPQLEIPKHLHMHDAVNTGVSESGDRTGRRIQATTTVDIFVQYSCAFRKYVSIFHNNPRAKISMCVYA